MSNSYELYASVILAKANNDNRAQPWKDNTAPTTITPLAEEWVEINTNNNNKPTDIRTNAFPSASSSSVLDVRANAFPNAALDARTNVFPVGNGALDIRSNAFPAGSDNEAIDIRSNAFPVGLGVGIGGGVSVQTNVFPF